MGGGGGWLSGRPRRTLARCDVDVRGVSITRWACGARENGEKQGQKNIQSRPSPGYEP